MPRAQTLSRRRRQATDLRRRGSRIKFRHIQLLFRRRRHRCRRFTLSLRRRHRSAPERRSVLASLVRLNYRRRRRRRVIHSSLPPSRCKTKLPKPIHINAQMHKQTTRARTRRPIIARVPSLRPFVRQRVSSCSSSHALVSSSNFTHFVQMSKCPNVRMSECPNVRLSECPNVRMSECPM